MQELPKDKKIVILDFDIPQLMGNKIFNPASAKKISHTILPTCYLYQEAQKQGIQFVTPDIFLDLKNKPKNPLLISHLTTPFTKQLISCGAEPTILTCQESPFIATRFYAGLKKYTGLFKHSFLFSGMKKWVSKKTIYHQMFFPQSYNISDFKPIDFSRKKFLTAILSAKKISNWGKRLFLKLMYGFSVREIYSERVKAINFFSQKPSFDLFGFLWDKANFRELKNSTIQRVYRGIVEDKIETLRNYKFSLCFENAAMEGYVTEKIFDAMFAGCLPIYYGVPDIEKYVDKNCFIDFREFRSYSELHYFLLNIEEAEYNQYIENIKKYLQSDLYKKFTQESFTKEILTILQQEFENYV